MPQYSVRIGGHEIFKVSLHVEDCDTQQKRNKLKEIVASRYGAPMRFIRFENLDRHLARGGKFVYSRTEGRHVFFPNHGAIRAKSLDVSDQICQLKKDYNDLLDTLSIARRNVADHEEKTKSKIKYLLSETDRHPKVYKNGWLGVYSRIMHLAPAKSSGFNVCARHTEGCAAACLNWAGFKYQRKQRARVNRTRLFFESCDVFMDKLALEIFSSMKSARRANMVCGIRLNGTSDIKWENMPWRGYSNLMLAFPGVHFMDYTKILNRNVLPENYRLTFSRSENNDIECHEALATRPYKTA